MNREEKNSIGYPTPAKQLESAISEIRQELAKIKGDWQALGEKANAGRELASELLASKIPRNDIGILILFKNLELLISLVAKLGQQVIDMHERLVAIDREIKNLKISQ
jgi:hypothetical protein